jgi:hypothetical protein
MLPEKVTNFLRSFVGLPLPVDEVMMGIASDLKVTVAKMTTGNQRLVLLATFPEADLDEAFEDNPPREDPVREVRYG